MSIKNMTFEKSQVKPQVIVVKDPIKQFVPIKILQGAPEDLLSKVLYYESGDGTPYNNGDLVFLSRLGREISTCNINSPLIKNGYYDASKDIFWKEEGKFNLLPRLRTKLYKDIGTDTFYYLDDDNKYKVLFEIPKLYREHGYNEDGTMTQKAITQAIEQIELAIQEDETETFTLKKPW